MKRVTCLLIFGFLVLMGTPGRTLADVYTATPTQAVVLADDGTNVVRVAFLFDLSGLRQGETRHIEEALLDWRIVGLDAEAPAAFGAYMIMNAWTKASVQSGTAPAMAEVAAADWLVSSLAKETTEGKLVRLDVTDLVGSWASGVTANYGVVVATSALDAKAIANQLTKVQLTVRYGFREDWGSE
jgi:hypothetical protein